MQQAKLQWSACALAVAGAVAWGGLSAHANDDRDRDDRGEGRHGRTVFVVAMENHNWTQPASVTSPQAIFQNPYAPYINSLVDGTSGISGQVAYATNYLNAAVGDHPSEPNYIWAEAGTNFGVNNDDDPYHKADCSPDTVQTTDQHLSAFLMKAHRSWKSYQEDTDVDLTTNQPLPASAWTVPIFSISGTFGNGLNAYTYSNQYNYAAKHNPMVFFTDTNGGCNTATSNPLRTHYAPLQQLALDLQHDTVADYNWITPDQYNDQHTRLNNGYGGASGTPNKDDRANIAQGDNFLARIVPLLMASDAYQDHGVILLWWDETEGGDTADFKLPFIVISKDAHPNVGGVPFASSVELSHSSTLRTMQEIFDVDPHSGFPWLGDAAVAHDLSSLFRPGTIR
ncbi:MAG TPA: alkaline phosphatase family protein [Vicinamibacterales bacterium]|nr:alkaline phosphatase family protein [Vicinamibacterales bacterium]